MERLVKTPTDLLQYSWLRYLLFKPVYCYFSVISKGIRCLPLRLPDSLFRDKNERPDSNIRWLRKEHLYAALSVSFLVLFYLVFYVGLHPVSDARDVRLPSIPAVAYIFAWLSLSIWLLMAAWFYIRRYRLFLLLLFVGSMVVYAFGSMNMWESRLRGASHIYDVDQVHFQPLTTKAATPSPTVQRAVGSKSHRKELHVSLQPEDVFTSLASLPPKISIQQNGEHTTRKPTLIIVSASGGGILAAGWTAQVLTSLEQAYPDFAKELRFISSNSGGAVGTAHYLYTRYRFQQNPQLSRDWSKLQRAFVDHVTDSSLATVGYGLFFSDFRRAFLPFLFREPGRGRLLENAWRNRANRWTCQQACQNSNSQMSRTCMRHCLEPKRLRLYDMRTQIKQGNLPGFVFSSTVMENGALIGLTPMEYLSCNRWSGGKEPEDEDSNGARIMERYINIPTLSEFLRGTNPPTEKTRRGEESRCSEQRRFQAQVDQTPRSENPPPWFGYTLDLWTAARLSATYSFISPAARAAIIASYKDNGVGGTHTTGHPKGRTERWLPATYIPLQHVPKVEEQPNKLSDKPRENRPDKQHLIDGGYHDNYGVSPALAWLHTALYNHQNKHWRPSRKNDPAKFQRDRTAHDQIDRDFWPFGQIAWIEIRAGSDAGRIKKTPASAWLSAFTGPLQGLLNSWSLTQRTANDNLLYHTISRLRQALGIKMRTFVFAYPQDGPSSWHMSRRQKEELLAAWNEQNNQKTLSRFCQFVQADGPNCPWDKKTRVQPSQRASKQMPLPRLHSLQHIPDRIEPPTSRPVFPTSRPTDTELPEEEVFGIYQ